MEESETLLVIEDARCSYCIFKAYASKGAGGRKRRVFLRATPKQGRHIRTIRLSAGELAEVQALPAEGEKVIDWCARKLAEAGHWRKQPKN